MAISFVGSKTFPHNFTTAQTCSLTDLVDDTGATATLAPGDIVIVNQCQADSLDRTSVLLPSGYTGAHTGLYANDINDISMLVSYKVMGATPDTNVTIAATRSTAIGSCSVISVYRGVDTTTPLDVTATTASNINSGVPDPPAITPSTAGAWIVVCGGGTSSAGSAVSAFSHAGDLSSATNHFRSDTSDPASRCAVAGTGTKENWASGAFDPGAWTGGNSGSPTAQSCAAATLALKPASGGGPANYTLTAAAGSFTLAGTAASLLAKRTLTASGGSLTLTGTAASFNKGYAFTASPGSFAITGTNAGLTAQRKIAAAVGSYALTGTAATLARGLKITAASGSYTLTGTDATLTKTSLGAYTLTASSGAYSLTGTQASLTRSAVLTAASGSYALTGQNAGLARGLILLADTGAYGLTGTDADLSYAALAAYSMAAEAGDYRLNGSDALMILFDRGALLRGRRRRRGYSIQN